MTDQFLFRLRTLDLCQQLFHNSILDQCPITKIDVIAQIASDYQGVLDDCQIKFWMKKAKKIDKQENENDTSTMHFRAVEPARNEYNIIQLGQCKVYEGNMMQLFYEVLMLHEETYTNYFSNDIQPISTKYHQIATKYYVI